VENFNKTSFAISMILPKLGRYITRFS